MEDSADDSVEVFLGDSGLSWVASSGGGGVVRLRASPIQCARAASVRPVAPETAERGPVINHLYRFAPEGVWCLSDEFDPAKAGLDARCVTADGALPEGAAMWKCWVDDDFAKVEVTLALQ